MDYARNLSPKNIRGEKWIAVEGYEKRYEVSNFARIRSLMRGTSAGGIIKRQIPLIIKQHINTSGYYQIRIMGENKSGTLRVHRVVGIAFHPNPYNLPEINHLKGKLDNRPESIEWSTSSNNQKHAYANDLRKPLGGEKNPKCILKEYQVLGVFNSKLLQQEIADEYGISIHTVRHIKRGSTWSYLTGKKYVIKKRKK